MKHIGEDGNVVWGNFPKQRFHLSPNQTNKPTPQSLLAHTFSYTFCVASHLINSTPTPNMYMPKDMHLRSDIVPQRRQ